MEYHNPPPFKSWEASKWRQVIRRAQQIAEGAGSKLPLLVGLDSVHGANYVEVGTSIAMCLHYTEGDSSVRNFVVYRGRIDFLHIQAMHYNGSSGRILWSFRVKAELKLFYVLTSELDLHPPLDYFPSLVHGPGGSGLPAADQPRGHF